MIHEYIHLGMCIGRHMSLYVYTYMHIGVYKFIYMYVCRQTCIYVSQDKLFMLGPEITLSFSSVCWENPSLLHPYDIISDVINDITTTPRIYISWSI